MFCGCGRKKKKKKDGEANTDPPYAPVDRNSASVSVSVSVSGRTSLVERASVNHFRLILFCLYFLFSGPRFMLNFQVFRAMDPALIHRYHQKSCNPRLPTKQLNQCLNTLAEGYGASSQLAKKILMP